MEARIRPYETGENRMTSHTKSAGSQMASARGESNPGNLGHYLALAGFTSYAIFAPHSIAAAEISIAIAIVGWVTRTIVTRHSDIRRTEFDLPIAAFLIWTVISSIFSVEPAISIGKLQSSWLPVVFYVSQAVLTRKSALCLACLLILSGVAGTFYSLYDLARGRGVTIESIGSNSPFRAIDVQPGDTIWRIDGRRIYSVGELDHVMRQIEPGRHVAIGVISSGEQVERSGLVVTAEMKQQSSPSGITGLQRSHRFRASGWTRHYETFSEILQMIAQLSLGLALANLRNHGMNNRFRLAMLAGILLATGIALTAMRSVLVAFAVGASLIVWRSVRGRTRLALSAAIIVLLVVGSFVVWTTRAQHALILKDPSSSLRIQVARVALSRIMIHPVFGHGMDSIHLHWSEWGFPGREMVPMHSTPLQLAFDRGLPALFFWLWIVGAFLFAAARAERVASDGGDTNRYGLLLGIFGAVTGFFVSSLVNYNFGDAEVALLFWFLMGSFVSLRRAPRPYGDV
ncbi:MAG: hypothetical protein C5B44_02335 [Acidobacteria bacterium]|nr:MAG: hypothetical protein C5B44_02335 [Acidobacteriota bacterium]